MGELTFHLFVYLFLLMFLVFVNEYKVDIGPDSGPRQYVLGPI